MSNSNINLKARGHRLEIIDEGMFHCYLCNCVGFWEEIDAPCMASQADRNDFDDRYSLADETPNA